MSINYQTAGKLTRTSMALDSLTIQLLEDLSNYWGTSKAGVIRRAVQEAKERVAKQQAAPSPLQALEWLQGGGGVVREEAEEFRTQLQAERTAKKYWWEEA